MFVLLTVAATAYGVMCWRLAHFYLSPTRSSVSKPAMLNEVLIPTSVGATPAWTTSGLAKGEGDIVFVLAHGYGGDRDSWGDLMQELHERHGAEAVAPAMPGQDASPRGTVGFGTSEALVLVDTVHWVRAQYGQRQPKIVLVGLSMGGAAAWMAASIEPTVDGVVTEGAYADLNSAMRNWFDAVAPGASVFLRPVVWIASWRSGIRPASVVPEKAAEAWKGRPSLVIQASDDRVIPLAHAERLAKAAGSELWLVEGATHAQCQTVAYNEYADRLWLFAARL